MFTTLKACGKVLKVNMITKVSFSLEAPRSVTCHSLVVLIPAENEAVPGLLLTVFKKECVTGILCG